MVPTGEFVETGDRAEEAWRIALAVAIHERDRDLVEETSSARAEPASCPEGHLEEGTGRDPAVEAHVALVAGAAAVVHCVDAEEGAVAESADHVRGALVA